MAVPWARGNSGFTLLFEAYTMLPIESEMSVSKVSSCVKTTAARIRRIFNHRINPALSKDSLETVKRIGMDETSRKKGHHYVTLFADLEQRRIIHVCEGKDVTTVESFAEYLETKGYLVTPY